MLVRLNEDQATKILAEKRVGRLGCVVDGGPYVVPINYYYEDGCIYSHSLPGTKISALRTNRRGCLQVDEISSDLNWRSVLAYGSFEELVAAPEKAAVLNRLLSDCPRLTPVESAIAEDGLSQQVIAYRLRVDRISGLAEQ